MPQQCLPTQLTLHSVEAYLSCVVCQCIRSLCSPICALLWSIWRIILSVYDDWSVCTDSLCIAAAPMCTLYMHCNICAVCSAVCSVQFALRSVHTECSVQYAVCIAKCACSVHT